MTSKRVDKEKIFWIWIHIWMWNITAVLDLTCPQFPGNNQFKRVRGKPFLLQIFFVCFRQLYQIEAGFRSETWHSDSESSRQILGGFSAALELLLSMWWKSVFNCTSCGEVNKTKEEKQSAHSRKLLALRFFWLPTICQRAVNAVLFWP